MSDETTILPPERPTLEQLPSAANDTGPPGAFGVIEIPDAIPAGQAESAFAEALDALATAFVRCEALGMSYARALDAAAEGSRS